MSSTKEFLDAFSVVETKEYNSTSFDDISSTKYSW